MLYTMQIRSMCLVDFYSHNQIIALRVFIILNLVFFLVFRTIQLISYFIDNPGLYVTLDFVASHTFVLLQFMSAVVYLVFGI